MKGKQIVFLVILAALILFGAGCDGNEETETYPDVAGTWDWHVDFSVNECDGGTGYDVVLKITQDGNTGTWESYDDEDTGFACVIEKGTYTLDTEGNVTIDLEDYTPGACSSIPEKATVTIRIRARVNGDTMTGTHTEFWTLEGWVTDCKKEGSVTATKR